LSKYTREIQSLSAIVIRDIDSALWPDFKPTLPNIKYIMRHNFGLSVREVDRRPDFGDNWIADCVPEMDDEYTLRATVHVMPGLPDDSSISAHMHELGEFLAVRHAPGLWDGHGEPGFGIAFTGGATPRDIRHQAAASVQEHYTRKFRLSVPDPVEAARIEVDVIRITAMQWHLSHPPLAETEHVKMDDCI
jgi:hypothetical protein